MTYANSHARFFLRRQAGPSTQPADTVKKDEVAPCPAATPKQQASDFVTSADRSVAWPTHRIRWFFASPIEPAVPGMAKRR